MKGDVPGTLLQRNKHALPPKENGSSGAAKLNCSHMLIAHVNITFEDKPDSLRQLLMPLATGTQHKYMGARLVHGGN